MCVITSSLSPVNYLSIYLSIYLPIYLSTYLPIYLSTYLPIYLSTYLPTYLSTYVYINIWYYYFKPHIYIYNPIISYPICIYMLCIYTVVAPRKKNPSCIRDSTMKLSLTKSLRSWQLKNSLPRSFSKRKCIPVVITRATRDQ